MLYGRGKVRRVDLDVVIEARKDHLGSAEASSVGHGE
jgi:hypothetical protein